MVAREHVVLTMTHLYATSCPDCDRCAMVADIFDRTAICVACGLVLIETVEGTDMWQLGSLGELASGDRPVIGGAC